MPPADVCIANIGPRDIRRRLLTGLAVLSACLAAAIAYFAAAGPPWLAFAFLPALFLGFLALGQARAKT